MRQHLVRIKLHMSCGKESLYNLKPGADQRYNYEVLQIIKVGLVQKNTFITDHITQYFEMVNALYCN